MFSKTKKVYTIQAEPTNGSPRSNASSPSSPRSNASSPRSRFNFKSLTKLMGSKPPSPSPTPTPSPTTSLTPAEQEELADIRAQAEQELEIGRDVTEQWRKTHGKNPMTLQDYAEIKQLTKEALINAGFTDGFNTGGKTRKSKGRGQNRRGSKKRMRRGSRKRMRKSKRSRR
jgi:hypothetical protein